MYRILTFTQEIFNSMASGKQTDVAVMDFSKAFDKVDHQRLILKLKRMGINNKTSNWIGAWLSHRFQRVVVDDHTSNSCPDTLKSNVRLFADDTIVYLTISALTDCHTLQTDLHKLEKWEEEWLMSFNPDKCEIIHISRKQKPILFQYTLHNQVLKSTNKAKYLGVTITNDLTWNHHINNITNKENASLRFIKTNVKTNSIKTKELGYKTYVRPRVE